MYVYIYIPTLKCYVMYVLSFCAIWFNFNFCSFVRFLLGFCFYEYIYMLLWYICLYVFIIYVMNILYVSFLIYHFVEWRSNCSTTTGNKHIVYFLCFLLTYTVCVYKQINDINITTDMYGCIIIIYIHCITSYAELDVLFTVCAHN